MHQQLVGSSLLDRGEKAAMLLQHVTQNVDNAAMVANSYESREIQTDSSAASARAKHAWRERQGRQGVCADGNRGVSLSVCRLLTRASRSRTC